VLGWATARLEMSRENLLVPGRCTSALALSYYARFCLGIAAPLLFITLQLLFPDLEANGYRGAGRQTAFYKVYGSQVVLNGITRNLALYVPTLLVVLVLLQAFKVHRKGPGATIKHFSSLLPFKFLLLPDHVFIPTSFYLHGRLFFVHFCCCATLFFLLKTRCCRGCTRAWATPSTTPPSPAPPRTRSRCSAAPTASPRAAARF